MANTRSNDPSRRLGEILGGSRTLGPGPASPAVLQTAVREGLPYGSFESVRRGLDVPAADLARILGLAPRTLARRKVERHLSSIESDRLVRVARALALATTILGSPEKGRAWLRRGNRALGLAMPMSLLDTEIGAREVEEALHRLDAGIYA